MPAPQPGPAIKVECRIPAFLAAVFCAQFSDDAVLANRRPTSAAALALHELSHSPCISGLRIAECDPYAAPDPSSVCSALRVRCRSFTAPVRLAPRIGHCNGLAEVLFASVPWSRLACDRDPQLANSLCRCRWFDGVMPKSGDLECHVGAAHVEASHGRSRTPEISAVVDRR